MTEQQQRAARVLAYLEKRTTANGCTQAEADAARQKAREIRERYKVEAAKDHADLDYLKASAEVHARLDDLLASLILLTVQLENKRKRKPGRRRPRWLRFRWSTPYRR